MPNFNDEENLLDSKTQSYNPDSDSPEAKLAKLIKQKQMLDLINPPVNIPKINPDALNTPTLQEASFPLINSTKDLNKEVKFQQEHQDRLNNGFSNPSVNKSGLNATQLSDLNSTYLDPREYKAQDNEQGVSSLLNKMKELTNAENAPMPKGISFSKQKASEPNVEQSTLQNVIQPQQSYIQKLTELQNQANEKSKWLRLAQAFSQGRAEMMGKKEDAFSRGYDEDIKAAQSIPAQFIALKEQEKNDPNSPSSKHARAIYKQITGEDAPSDVSSADLEKQNPIIASMMKKREEIASREFIAGENAKQRAHALEMLKLERDEKAKQNLLLKDEQTMMKINDKWLSPSMGSSRANSARAQGIINGAEKIDALIKSKKDPNDLTNRDVYEIAKSLDAMLSIGSPTISGTDKLKAKSILSELSTLGEMVLNRPVGARLGDFVKNTAHLIERERKTAQNQLNAVHEQLLEGIPETYKQRNPEEMKKLTKRLFENQMKAEYPEHSLLLESDNSSKQNSQEVGKISGLTPDQRRKRIEELKNKIGQ